MNGQSLKYAVQDFKKDVKKQVSALKKNRDLQKYIPKLNTQKKRLEKNVKKAITEEIKWATAFLKAQKKELDQFHKTVKMAIKRKIKKNKSH
jgi:hypothetical protein